MESFTVGRVLEGSWKGVDIIEFEGKKRYEWTFALTKELWYIRICTKTWGSMVYNRERNGCEQKPDKNRWISE